MKPPPIILVFSPSGSGGIAEHTFYQAEALQKLGAHVSCLVTPSFLVGRSTGFEKIVCLRDMPAKKGWRPARLLKMVWRSMVNQSVLAYQIWRRRPHLVLLDSYAEYLSPLWIWPHWLLARFFRICYGANLHDPVRNFVLGPEWWHKLSVAMTYLPLEFVLVHNKLTEPSPVPSRVRVVQVPVGIYEINGKPIEPRQMRQTWGVRPGQKVFLSFGFVRDDKNLDLVIRSMTQIPEAFLIIAGSVASGKDRPFTYYSELSAELGVTERCHFAEGFVSDVDLGNYFSGADFVLLTYSASFHSQSGVLNIAARTRKPVLASASPSPLLESVKKFQLGIVVKPDSVAAIVIGMQRLLSAPLQPRWEDYEAVASWAANARGIIDASGLYTSVVDDAECVLTCERKKRI